MLSEGMGSSPDITLFLSGDVMTGRGIDQILSHPSHPTLHETYVKDARRYVDLAERITGPIPRPASDAYVWGEALKAFDRLQPDWRIINLETAITTSDAFWRGKDVLYRMHPRNVGCLTVARVDCCVLANNHVLDWGQPGLAETLATLNAHGIKLAGAGKNAEEAARPAVLEAKGGPRILVFAWGAVTSGVPLAWRAGRGGGVNVLEDFSPAAVAGACRHIRSFARDDDVVVASIHWGANWGYDIGSDERRFAHALIEEGGVHVVHGHSSHHAKAIEVHQEQPILYGCGDLITDYEGIGGYEFYRGDLPLLYVVGLDRVSRRLSSLRIVPLRLKHFRLHAASAEEKTWVKDMLNREGAPFGTQFSAQTDGDLVLS